MLLTTANTARNTIYLGLFEYPLGEPGMSQELRGFAVPAAFAVVKK